MGQVCDELIKLNFSSTLKIKKEKIGNKKHDRDLLLKINFNKRSLYE